MNTPRGSLQYFRSRIDGQLQPCAVAETGPASEARPLIVEVSPGAMSSLERCVESAEWLARIAADLGEPCVALRATGRGSGSVYQNYGEVDALEAIEHVRANYDIDPERITVTGGSMGGAATWYLTSHYPDLFAGGAPFCGYCDYTKWEKPGGLTFHMHEWEEPSWRARSAATLLENFQHTPMHIVHGEWDRSVGGGVPVAHSISMSQGLAERGFAHEYLPVPECGHGCSTPETLKAAVAWMLRQRKSHDPDDVRLVVPWLRHSRSYWVCVEALTVYGQPATVQARRDAGAVTVTTSGAAALALGPSSSGGSFELTVDGTALGSIDLAVTTRYARDDDGSWRLETEAPDRRKRPGVSGPISDLFIEGTILVPGTAGTEEETFFNQWVADHAVGYFRHRNGGVHRGGIMGDNVVELPLTADADLDEESRRGSNLLLYGAPTSNSVFARYADALPIAVGDRSITLAGKTYEAPGVAAIAIFPHPESARYVAVHAGTTPDAITWGSHLDMQLLPDYLVYAGGELLDWGFFDGDWQVVASS